MEIDLKPTEVRDLVEKEGGVVIDSGYESFGTYTKRFLEVSFETVPKIDALEDAENVKIDDTWNPEKNWVMYEVTLSTR